MAEKTFSVLDFGVVSNSDNQTAAFLSTHRYGLDFIIRKAYNDCS